MEFTLALEFTFSSQQKKRKKNEISAFFPLAVLHNRDKIS